ncbi:acyltransferase [Vibrio sp. Vb2354]|nr:MULTISPECIES: acyltransferase [unclassified Vibrio]MDW1737813.1 acyltransferase [Vibrio sp. Vb2321]MDW1756931.1 acyltransferase [Vibrio sp. Vb2353]MDW1771234.1 acyltransferase [Vibrio sp. Vb2354]MDW1807558.1 acyltransferase [Vibrio sp. Vb2362]
MLKTLIKSIKSSIEIVKLRLRGVSIGSSCYISNARFNHKSVQLESNCRIVGDPKIIIGSNLYINAGVHMLGDIIIGDNVLIGPKSVIWGRDHGVAKSELIRNQEHERKPIVIEDDVWIGANVTILKGVTLGRGAVIGAGSIVTKSVEPYTIVAGNPAKKIGERK